MTVPKVIKWFISGMAAAIAVVAAFFIGKKTGGNFSNNSSSAADKAREDMKNEIEKTDAADLVSQSANSGYLRTEITDIKRKFNTDADRAIRDVLRSDSVENNRRD